MEFTGLQLEIFRRLAELDLARLDDDSCAYLFRSVLNDMKARKKISSYERCRVLWHSANGEPNQPWVEAVVYSNRGFMEQPFLCPKAWLKPEMIPVVEVMTP